MRQQAILLAAIGLRTANAKVFSVNEDFLAFPQARNIFLFMNLTNASQYKIVFSEKYILDIEAESSLALAPSFSATYSSATAASSASAETLRGPSDLSAAKRHGESGDQETTQVKETYEYMMLGSAPYLCTLPVISEPKNQTEIPRSKEDETKELARATDRGWELLQQLEGQCLYFSSGWWSYSFCHNRQIKQFHALPVGRGQSGAFTPVEDVSVPSFVLGEFPRSNLQKSQDAAQDKTKKDSVPKSDVARAQTRGDMRYMVQKLHGGDICDITGRPRKIEVQFHCHPQSTDRIGLIKEVSTCAYLMVIYTPRLCNDVAFQPSKESEAQQITCKEILKESEVEQWQARKSVETRNRLDGKSTERDEKQEQPPSRPIVGGIELGGQKEVGGEGRRIDVPKVVYAPEERAGEIVVKWHPDENNGKVQQMTDKQLQELELNGAVVREMKEALEEIANGKPFELRVVEKGDGVRELRGIVDDEGDDSDLDTVAQDQEGDPNGGNQGSDETYKDEL